MILFARAPQLGQGKTRLSPFLSPRQRLDLSRALLAHVAETVRSAGLPWVVACAGDPACLGFESPALLFQRGQTLGERMFNAFSDVGCPAVMVGSDLPDLTRDKILALVRGLDQAQVTLLRAEDGGYGGLGMTALYDLFTDVVMSRQDTAWQTLNQARILGLKACVVGQVRDLDRYDDYLWWKGSEREEQDDGSGKTGYTQ